MRLFPVKRSYGINLRAHSVAKREPDRSSAPHTYNQTAEMSYLLALLALAVVAAVAVATGPAATFSKFGEGEFCK